MILPVLGLAVMALAAAPTTVAIVDIDAPDSMLGLAAQVTNELIAEAEKQKYTVIRPDALRGKMDEKRYLTLKKCNGNPACVSNELGGFAARRAVIGSLGRDEKNYLFRLWLIDLETLEVVADVDRSVLIAARRLQKDVEQAIPPLLRGEKEARGRLIISSNLADAKVTVNGEPVGPLPQTITLRPGKHEVKAERLKYLPVTRLVGVEANQDTRVELKLLLIPGQIADADVVPALAKKEDVAAESAGTVSPLTWVLGGVTLAAAGTGLAFGLITRTQQIELDAGFDVNTGVWQGTRAQAMVANRNALIADVSFGIAGAALIATIVSAIVDGTRPAPVQVAPTVSPGGGAGLSLGVTF